MSKKKKKKIYSGFKNNKKNEKEKEKENIDLKRVDELTTVRKRDNLNIRDDSPLKPAFKKSKRGKRK